MSTPAAADGHPPAGAAGASGTGTSPLSDAERWDAASVEVRQTAKWTITAMAAAGAALFGAGPVLSIDGFSSEHLAVRLAVIVGSALVGVGGLAVLIWTTARVLVPYEATWSTLPASLAADIARDPRTYLPDELTGIDELRARRVAIERRLRVQQALLPGDEARLAWARANPSKVPSVEALVEDVRNRQAVIATEAGNLALYDNARRGILAKARYVHVDELFAGHGRRVVAAALAVVLGGTGFLLAVNYASDDESSGADASASPVPGVLVRHDDGTSDELWAAAGLADCDDAAGRVAVLVDAGAGTPDDPYVVRPVSTVDACAGLQFSVIDAVATVVVPEPRQIEITYEPD